MTLVRSNDTYTKVQFGIEGTYDTAPTYNDTNYWQMPFLGETLKIERETLPMSEEFSAFGGMTGVDLGKSRVRGSISFEPVYNSQWMWVLFGLGFSHENVVQNKSIDGVTITDPADGVNAHVFTTGQTLKSLTMYVWKAGPELPSASNWVDKYTGLYISQWKWEQPEGNRARVTLDFIGKSYTTVAANTLTSGPTQSLGHKVNVQHLGTGTNTGIVCLGAQTGLVETNLTGFTITCNRKIDDTSPSFINDVTAANNPGIEGTREVTIDFTTNLETNYAAAGKPYKLFQAGTPAAFYAQYNSGVAISTTPATNYGISIGIPQITLTACDVSINKSGTQTVTGSGMASVQLWGSLAPKYDDDFNVPTTGGDVQVITVVKTTAAAGNEEISADGKFTGLADA